MRRETAQFHIPLTALDDTPHYGAQGCCLGNLLTILEQHSLLGAGVFRGKAAWWGHCQRTHLPQDYLIPAAVDSLTPKFLRPCHVDQHDYGWVRAPR